MKRQYCLFVYSTKDAKAAGEMEYTVDADDLDEAVETADAELDEGMYCVSIFRRTGTPSPMEFVESHIRPLVPTQIVDLSALPDSSGDDDDAALGFDVVGATE